MTTTEAIPITDFRVRQTLREIVDEFGADYVYPKAGDVCVYFEDGKPDCLVGQVIHRLTPEMPDPEGSVSFSYVEFRKAGYSDTACAALYVAQQMQDNGDPWGACARAAGAVMREGYAWQPDAGE